MLALNSFLYLENEVTNNLVAYLSRREKAEHDTGLSNTQQIRMLILVTVLHLTITYVFIRLYLRLKHSEAISIAERNKAGFSETLISFKKLTYGVLVLGALGVCNYAVVRNMAVTILYFISYDLLYDLRQMEMSHAKGNFLGHI